MKLPWSFGCVRAPARARMYVCMCVCVSVRERLRFEGVCVGGGDMVYRCGSEGGQDENSDYTCAEYIAY